MGIGDGADGACCSSMVVVRVPQPCFVPLAASPSCSLACSQSSGSPTACPSAGLPACYWLQVRNLTQGAYVAGLAAAYFGGLADVAQIVQVRVL